MPDKSHWPFGVGEGEGTSREQERALEREREREAHMREMAAKSAMQQARNNRLIVGGKAHTKKPGLS